MDSYAQILNVFLRPPAEHSPVPFWFLNEVLEPERLSWQLHQMHAQHVDAVVLHPRPGMVTEYLSPDFWRAIGACIKTAKELGMRVWLYDEYPWASGIAGGKVPAASSDYVMKNMDMLANDVVGPSQLDWPLPRQVVSLTAAPVVSTSAINPERMIDLTPFVLNGHVRWQVPEGTWRVMAVIVRRGLTTFDDPYGTQYWADLTNPEGVNLFMKLTHEEYLARFGSEFGKTIWGVFTDEPPSTFPAWGVNVPKRFRELKGYEMSTILPMLWYDSGPRTAVARCDYFETVARCYEEAFFARTGKWCEEHGLELGGHLLLEENLVLNTRFMTDAFRQLRHLQAPGIDWIFPGQIPAYVPKLAASIAHNYGRKRVLSETFALAGWAADMQWMRWQTQWEFVHGIDLLVPHAFFYSISDTVPIPPAPDNIGYRWYDCPPSMFYQQPYWRFYHCFADMEARSSYLLSRGTHVAQAAVYYPIESVWADFRLSDGWLRGVHANALDVPGTWMTADKLETGPAAVVTDSCYRAIIDGLREHNLDVDIVDNDSVLNATILEGSLLFKQEQFRVLILPAVHTIRRATLTKLVEFWRSGGVLIALRSLPNASPEYGANDPEISQMVTEIWGQRPSAVTSDRRAMLFNGSFEAELQGVMSQLTPVISIDTGLIYSQQRHLPDLDLFYLVSMHKETVAAEVRIHGLGIPELWDPMTGLVQPISVFRQENDVTIIPLEFEPYGAVFVGLQPGTPVSYVTSSNLRQVALEVQGNQVIVRGIAIESGIPQATVQLGQQEYHLVGKLTSATNSLPLGETWDFEALAVPSDSYWHADMDRLELMIPADCIPTQIHTASWSRQGLAGFSGIGRYSQTIGIPQEWVQNELTLDLGQVKVACQVYLNGVSQGERTWAPYTFTLHGVKPGANELVIEVANTLANYISVRHADSTLQWAHFTDTQLDSGLLGPVRLNAAPRVELNSKAS